MSLTDQRDAMKFWLGILMILNVNLRVRQSWNSCGHFCYMRNLGSESLQWRKPMTKLQYGVRLYLSQPHLVVHTPVSPLPKVTRSSEASLAT